MDFIAETDWVEKYRPRILEDVVLPDALARKLAHLAGSGQRMSLLFYGRPGSGKTSTARVMSPDTVVEHDCSTDRSINTIRTIRDQCSTVCVYGRRVVVLDEIDSLTAEAQGALKGTIELLSACNDFIGITNHVEKISDAIKSRLYPVCFDHRSDPAYMQKIQKRLEYVLEEEKRPVPPPSVMRAIVQEGFPDIRSMLKRLQFETA